MAAQKKATTRARGNRSEECVAEWLRAHGFEIVARNLRLGYLEIDIVAREGPVIAVVEVRSRRVGAYTSGFSSFSATKKKRIRWAGERLWNRRYRSDPTVERLRYDAASVTWLRGSGFVEYVRAAF